MSQEQSNGVVAWIRLHPIGTFVIWFTLVGQGFASMPQLLPDVPPQPFIAGMFLPALVITRIADGPEGYRRLWERVGKIDVGSGWYAFAILILPVPAVVMALMFFGAPDSGASVAAALVLGFVVQGVLVFVTNNLWEEVAVMGFVQARLQDRHGPMRAVVLATLLFTYQHITLIIVSGSFAVLFVFFLVTVFGFRALSAWTYNRTQSLFIVGLLHAASNAATGGSGSSARGYWERSTKTSSPRCCTSSPR